MKKYLIVFVLFLSLNIYGQFNSGSVYFSGLTGADFGFRAEEATYSVPYNFNLEGGYFIQNRFSDTLVEMARNGASPWEIMETGVGKIRKAYFEGDVEWGSLTFGQVCGLIDDIPTCRELIESITSEAEDIMESMQQKIIAA